jgi:hypothetical protein
MKLPRITQTNVQKSLLSTFFLSIFLLNITNTILPNPSIPATALQGTAFGDTSFMETAVLPAAQTFVKSSPMTSLQNFVLSVTNGDSEAVVGVYVPGVLALPVGQQPKGNAGFVTRERNMTTQFDLANKYGTIGILAHNYLAGDYFYGIELDQYAIVVYGDGKLEYFIIDEIQKYEALSPNSTYSDFINLDEPGVRLSASEVFGRVYGAGNRLVFQTCIAANGDSSWGRMFIIARPATNQVSSVLQDTSFMLRFASFGLATQ